jgi:hypothetical protein
MVIMAKRLPDERAVAEGAEVAAVTASSRLSDASFFTSVGSYDIARSVAAGVAGRLAVLRFMSAVAGAL